MASVFLSYAREDLAKARSIADALEEAGHAVWWDRHLRGGSEYSEEIEEALNSSDRVVVLWSTHSVKSAWVRDEAAAGRERGCLVPVLIDRVRQPMGFRQYQAVDLSSRSERKRKDGLAALLSALGPSLAADTLEPRNSPEHKPVSKPRFAPIAALALLLAILGAALWWWRSASGSGPQVVAIAPAEPGSRPLAQAILVNLAELPSAQSGSVSLVDASAQAKADLLFQASATGNASGGLSLISANDGDILWSKQFEPSAGNLPQRLSVAAAKVLECAVEGLNGQGAPLKKAQLKLYLRACANLAEIGWDKATIVAAMRQILSASPDFAPAWAKLLQAETENLQLILADGRDAAKARLVSDIGLSRKVDPELAEATLAEATLRTMPPIAPVIELIDRAKTQDSTNEAILVQRSQLMQLVGRFREAIADAKSAMDIDPLSAEVRSHYILTLAYAGQLDKARAELAEAKRLWPDARTLGETETSLDIRFGDFDQAIRAGAFTYGPGTDDYLAMRRNPSDATVERLFSRATRATLNADRLSFGLQAFSEVGRPDKSYELLAAAGAKAFPTSAAYILFRPGMSSFRADPRFMILADRLGLLDYWRSTESWPDFCENPQLPYDCKKEAAKLRT